jgi:hypothetical protein
MTHAFMEPKEKEAAKAEWGFAAVPFLVVAVGGQVVISGSPKVVTLEVIQKELLSPALTSPVESEGATTKTPIELVDASAAPEAAASVAQVVEPAMPAFSTDEDF